MRDFYQAEKERKPALLNDLSSKKVSTVHLNYVDMRRESENSIERGDTTVSQFTVI